MTIRFACPDCGKKLKAPEEYVGRQVQCTGCGTVQDVPELAGAAATHESPLRRARAERPLAETASMTPPAAVATAESGGGGSSTPVPVLKASPPPQDDGLDMTPMVDVTFLLLIFFMVTAAFALQKSIHIPTPDPTDSASQSRSVEELEKDDDYIIVRIDRDDSVWVDDLEAPSPQELLAKLKEKLAGGDDTDSKGPSKMMVMANGDARHETVVMVLDTGTAAGIDDVRLATGGEDDF
jgi:biopolymer transport protein ExbD